MVGNDMSATPMTRFLPGILRAGGLSNAAALLAPRPSLLHNTGDSFDASWARSAYELKHPQSTGTQVKLFKEAQHDQILPSFFSQTKNVR